MEDLIKSLSALPSGLIPAVTAVTGFIGFLVSGVVAITVCYLNNRNTNKKTEKDLFAQSSKTYKELITSERIKWLNSLRNSMTDYISKLNIILIRIVRGNNIENELITDLIQSSYLVRFYLNPNQRNHHRLEKDINDLNELINECMMFSKDEIEEEVAKHINDNKGVFDKADFLNQKLYSDFQSLLKNEWEFVKEEARPKVVSKKNILHKLKAFTYSKKPKRKIVTTFMHKFICKGCGDEAIEEQFDYDDQTYENQNYCLSCRPEKMQVETGESMELIRFKRIKIEDVHKKTDETKWNSES
jgi:Zn finger protein HypA/HybF involved in hydrogenase expression